MTEFENRLIKCLGHEFYVSGRYEKGLPGDGYTTPGDPPTIEITSVYIDEYDISKIISDSAIVAIEQEIQLSI